MSQLEMDLFERMLENHDWTYHYSDDHRYYIKGRDQAHKIRTMMERLEEVGQGDQAKELFEKYRPEFI